MPWACCLRGWLRRSKRVILNMAAQAEAIPEIFHSPHCYLAFKQNRGFQAANGLRYDNHALQAFTLFQWLLGDAIESFTAEIFRSALNRSSGMPEQMHRQMHYNPRASAATAGR